MYHSYAHQCLQFGIFLEKLKRISIYDAAIPTRHQNVKNIENIPVAGDSVAEGQLHRFFLKQDVVNHALM